MICDPFQAGSLPADQAEANTHVTPHQYAMGLSSCGHFYKFLYGPVVSYFNWSISNGSKLKTRKPKGISLEWCVIISRLALSQLTKHTLKLMLLHLTKMRSVYHAENFYRIRVRSLAMFVSNSLTNWLTDSLLFSKLDAYEYCCVVQARFWNWSLFSVLQLMFCRGYEVESWSIFWS